MCTHVYMHSCITHTYTHIPYTETEIIIKSSPKREINQEDVLRMLELLEDGVHKTARTNHRTSKVSPVREGNP